MKKKGGAGRRPGLRTAFILCCLIASCVPGRGSAERMQFDFIPLCNTERRQLEFEWDPAWFSRPPGEYNHSLARICCFLSAASYSLDADGQPADLVACYGKLGADVDSISCHYGLDYSGEQGNDQVDAFQYLATYAYSSSTTYRALYDQKEVNFILPDGVPNANITWEVARTWNIGLDGNIHHGLLGWELEYFHTRRSNILCTRNASIPYYTGLTGNLPDENIGIVSNKGVEFQLTHENKALAGDLRYRVAGNIMYAKNVIEYMDETPYDEKHQYMNRTGHPMGATLIYQVAGINRSHEDLQNHLQMAGAGLGDFYFEDLDDNGIIDSQDRMRMDLTAVPQLVFGLNSELQWKNLDLSILLQGQGLARYYYAPLTDPVSGNIEADVAVNAWNLDNPDSNYPRIASNIGNGGVYRTSFYYRNAAFLRLKNLELGYTLPGRVFGHQVGIKSTRFYAAGYNLLTFSELKTIDPETSDEGYQTYPQVKIFNFGVKVTF